MDALFTPWRLGTLEIPNRLVRSATWEALAPEDGKVTPELAEVTADLARGGVGLIITGFAYVHDHGQALPRQTGAHTDDHIEPLASMATAVHASGGKIALQIVHAGGQTKRELIGRTPLAPSPMHAPGSDEAVELSRDQIAEIVAAFGAAARRAKEAGFDAVQLHGAHGYLVNAFLSPNTNRRTDEYGGSAENRARFCYEVYDAVREAVGPDYPVFIKLNSEDFVDGGLEPAESLEVARGLARRGIDAIEVSGGTPASGKQGPARVLKAPENEAYFLANARAVKEAVDCPVIVVGGFRSRSKIEEALESVDAVSICRPFIRQPDLANLLRDGVTDKADCISCGRCFVATLKHGLSCGVVIGEESR